MENTTTTILSTTILKAILEYLTEYQMSTRQNVAETIGNITLDRIKYHLETTS